MIDRSHALPIRRQAEELGLSRSTVYYRPRPVPAADLAIMRRIDELHLDYPFAGARMLRDLLNGEGIRVGRDRVVGMMKRMGIEAIYRRPNTSKPAPGHKIYPYLLRKTAVVRPNQAWAMDITYSAPRPGWSGVHMTGMQRRKEENGECLALCCEGARAQAAVTCCQLAG
jgi:putative transposase